MDLLCEPDMSGLLADLLCTPWISCCPASYAFLVPAVSPLTPAAAQEVRATLGLDTGGPTHYNSIDQLPGTEGRRESL